jgi:hypothetical protein
VDNYPLDGDLYYLGQETQGAVRLVLLETPQKVFPLFTSKDKAAALLHHQTILNLHKDDPRAKEEIFRAAMAAGAIEVRIDHSFCIPIQQALDYILSFKNQNACF